MTERLRIEVGGIHLEALWTQGTSSKAVIIAHPHPLYGGSMDNNVVEALHRVYLERGWSTLRFNFRGVGASGGAYGEGEGEAEDVIGVWKELHRKGCGPIHFAGYSFGAWVGLRACRRGFFPESSVLVSPPVGFLDFSGLRLPRSPCLVVVGDRDEFAGASEVQGWLDEHSERTVEVRLEVLSGCDHFYWGREPELSRVVGSFLEELDEPLNR